MSKKWYKSKTLWFNGISSSLLMAESNLHFLQPMLPVNVYVCFAFILPIVNMWLRLISTQEIK
jgi:hypothetical protein